MANILQIKRRSIDATAPYDNDLKVGELAFNEVSDTLFIGKESSLLTEWTGNYDNGRTYTVGQGVMFSGQRYVMVLFIGAGGYTPAAYPAQWSLLSSEVASIGGTGKLVSLDTPQYVSADTSFTDVVALSSAVTVTQPTDTWDTSVANTEYVQNVFSVLDGGNFDDGSNGASVGKYWYTNTTANDADKWYTLGSWYADVNHTIPAASLPDSSIDVVILGNHGPYVDLDNIDWAQPKSINTGTAGMIFKSLTYKTVTINIVGDATFIGNATYNK